MNKEQLDNWKINLFNSLKELSNLEWQKLTWTGNHPTEASSFVEVINVLYDDNCFEEYIDYIKNNESNKNELYIAAIELNKMIDEYVEEGKSDLEILNDLEWIRITKGAEKVIHRWVLS